MRAAGQAGACQASTMPAEVRWQAVPAAPVPCRRGLSRARTLRLPPAGTTVSTPRTQRRPWSRLGSFRGMPGMCGWRCRGGSPGGSPCSGACQRGPRMQRSRRAADQPCSGPGRRCMSCRCLPGRTPARTAGSGQHPLCTQRSPPACRARRGLCWQQLLRPRRLTPAGMPCTPPGRRPRGCRLALSCSRRSRLGTIHMTRWQRGPSTERTRCSAWDHLQGEGGAHKGQRAGRVQASCRRAGHGCRRAPHRHTEGSSGPRNAHTDPLPSP